jgi:hypothetical protein
MQDHITRYDKMPIPPVEAHTVYFQAGAVTIGVEYRVLTGETALAVQESVELAHGADVKPAEEFDDRGVSLHVYGLAGNELVEYLRFDCFQEEPHYHYISWSGRTNEMLHIDPIADGDPLAWALERIRTRLPQMLDRAGAAKLAESVNLREIESAIPRIAEVAYRARFQADAARVQQ